MKGQFLGRGKLLAMGFRQIGKRTFCLTKKRWDAKSHREVVEEVGRVTLDSKGYVTRSSGFRQKDGSLMLRQR